MAITTATIIKVDAPYQKDGKDKQNAQVNVPGVGEVKAWGFPSHFVNAVPGGTINVEQSGNYWNVKGGYAAPVNGAPMSSSPATVTQGQGYGVTAHGYDHEAMKERAKNLTEIYLQIAAGVTGSFEFKHAGPDVIAAATATIFISTRP